MRQVEVLNARKYRRLRPVAAGFAGVVALLCLGFSLAWYFGARATTRTLDALISAEREQGRLWSCPDRRIGGFPFAIELVCTEPQFTGLLSGKPATLHARSLRAIIHLLRPDEVTAQVEAPFALRSQDGRTNVSATWHALQIVLSGLPEPPAEIVFQAEALSVRGPAEGLGTLDAQAARVKGRIGNAADGRARAYDFRIAAQDVANPLLAVAFAAPRVDAFKAVGTITEAVFDAAAPPAENLETWRKRNGAIAFDDLVVSHAKTRIALRGTLRLDAAHRPQGRFDTESSGIEPILRHYGINPSLVTAGVLLNGLLGGQAARPERPGALRLPLRLEDGVVVIGPVHMSLRLPALY